MFTEGMTKNTCPPRRTSRFYERHKPDAKQANGRWRVDCSCGWRGPLVPLPGHGHGPWVEHFEAAPGYWQDHLGEWHEGEPPWDRCPHGVVGGDVWCHHCDGEPF